jgi:geranylgeranyl pyrophosphate synthase
VAVTPVTIHQHFSLIEPELKATLAYLQGMLPPEALALAEASAFSLATPGKLVRPAMVHLYWQASTGTPSDERVIKLAAATELIHLATLLHDDVLDESDLRRGKPTVRQRFGNRIAILGGDWLLAKASETLASLGNVTLVDLYAKVLAELCDGEVLQQSFAFQPLAEMTWNAYEAKTFKKTASLYVTALHATAILAELSEYKLEQAKRFGSEFGLAFQLRDDVMDYTSTPEESGKPVLDDIRNGLANAPILLAYQTQANQDVLDKHIATIYTLVEAEAPLEALNTACLNLKASLEKMKAIDATEAKIHEHCQQALAVVHAMPPSGARSVLEQLATINAHRNS